MTKSLHWFETKQLDRVTNFSTRTEILSYALMKNINAYYYCTFAKDLKYFGLDGRVKYLGILKNKYFKSIEFQILVIIKSVSIVLSGNENIIMVNQDLIQHIMPAFFINRYLRKSNKFITDIRTTPTDPESFEKDMRSFHSEFRYAIKYFDGFSFITPFMEKYLMKNYAKPQKSINWSSGVDVKLFNPDKYIRHKKDNFTLFYHGGISLSRGNLDLIKACEILIRKGYNIELIQVGILVDRSIHNYIVEQNLGSWCRLLAPVELDEIPQMIADCDLPVLPFPHFMAWRVSSPIKLMEYFAMGKKVLAPDMESFTDLIGKNSGMIFYFNSSEHDRITTIASALKDILDTKLLVKENFYPELRQFACDNLTWEKQASRLFDFCDTL